jgi:hypothetical protein
MVVVAAVGFLVQSVNRPLHPVKSQDLASSQSQPTPVVSICPASKEPELTLPAKLIVAPMPTEVKPLDPRQVVALPAEIRSAEVLAKPGAKPADSNVKLDARGFEIFSLDQRIDLRKSEEIQRQLQNLREVSLDPPGSTRVKDSLIHYAQNQLNRGEVYAGTILAPKWQLDLAGLPFQSGGDALLSKERAEAMNALSKDLREMIQKCTREGDVRPNTEDLFNALARDGKGAAGKRDRKIWATAEAVPCIQQMLQPENREIRRMSCSLLSGLEIPEATEALVKWAVFDSDPGNRAAAVAALKKRNRKEVCGLLTTFLRYPWPRAVEHVCEALIALDCLDAIPQLAQAFEQPDPDAPFRLELPGVSKSIYVREMVRVNHLRNCVMCHAPSFAQTDLVRGAVPDPNQPLPSPSQPTYYSQGSQFVTASVTYLKQDFSMFQPVANPGKWPEHQRYDYLVAIRPVTAAPPTATSENSPYRQAIAIAIEKLSSHNPSVEPLWLAQQRARAQQADNEHLEAVARFETIKRNPFALAAVKASDQSQSLLKSTPSELSVLAARWQSLFGVADTRLALIAYLAPYAQSCDAPERARAARMIHALTARSERTVAEAVYHAAQE